MTYRIYTETLKYDGRDAVCGSYLRLAHPYTFETVRCALAFRDKICKRNLEEYGEELAYEIQTTVRDERGIEHHSYGRYVQKDIEIPF